MMAKSGHNDWFRSSAVSWLRQKLSASIYSCHGSQEGLQTTAPSVYTKFMLTQLNETKRYLASWGKEPEMTKHYMLTI